MNLRLCSILCLVLPLLAASAYATPVSLGTASTFGLLAGSTVTNDATEVPNTVINGDVGVWTGSAVTGFPPGVINGNLHIADGVAQQAQSDLTTAYNTAAGATVTATLTGQDLGGMTLVPGVYFFSSSAFLTGPVPLTLKGTGDPTAQWIFQIGTALTTGAHSSVMLIDGATKCQVFWQVGSSATIGEGDFAGSIMADQSISLGGGTLNGGALARIGAVTISKAETVNAGPCGTTAPVPEWSSMALAMTTLIPAAGLFRRKRNALA